MSNRGLFDTLGVVIQEIVTSRGVAIDGWVIPINSGAYVQIGVCNH